MITLKVLDENLDFEHSLASLSEWESEFEKPFFPPALAEDQTKTEKEMLAYFEFMLVSSREQHHLVRLLDNDQQVALVNYLNKNRTATVVREIQSAPGPKENVTSELIYYWMIMLKIPFKPTDEWHLNRLLMLIKVCGAKNAKPEKHSRAKTAQNFREINEARRKASGSSG